MKFELNENLLRLYLRISRVFGLLVLTAGLTMVLGWVLRWTWLRYLWGSPFMLKANTALIVTGMGLALALPANLPLESSSALRRYLSQAVGLGSILIAALTLLEYLGHWNFGLDELFFRDWHDINSPYPGRMADVTALSLLFLGSALLTHLHARAWERLGQWFCLAGWLIAFTCFMGRLYNVPQLFRPSSARGMAFYSAVILQLVSFGLLLARPETGVTRVLASRGPGGLLLRVLLPLLFGSQFLLHWLLDRGARAGWYSHEWQEAVLAVASLLLVTLMLWASARWLERVAHEHQHTSLAFATSEERNRLTAEALNGLLYDWDVTTGTIDRSIGLKQLLGFEPDEVPAQADWWYPRLHPADKAALDPLIAETFRHQRAHLETEYRIRHRAGHWVWVSDRSRILYHQDGRVRRIVGSTIDITQRKLAEQVLRESEMRERAQAEQLRALMEAVPAIVWVAHDAACEVITGNRVATELLRMPPSSNLSKTGPTAPQLAHFKVLHEGSEIPPHELPMQQAARGIEVQGYEEEIVFDDGTRIYLYGHAVPLRDEAGQPCGAISAFVDITSLKKTEEALRESEARFRNMADHAPVMIWVTDATGHCTYLSQSWFEFTGQAAENGLGLGWLEAVHPADRAATEAAFLEATATHSNFRVEYQLRRQDGVYRWAIDSATPRFDGHGQFLGFIGSVIDITERKRAEEALRKSEERLRAALTASGTGTFRWDIQDDQLDWDGNLDRLFGLEPGQVPPSLAQFVALVEMAEREQVQAAFARCAAGEADFDLEFRVRWPDGQTHWLAAKGKTSRDTSGHPRYLTGACLDITVSKELEAERERLFAEEQHLRTQAEQHNRAKDEFLSVVSHELRSPLNSVLGYARLARMNAFKAPEVIRHCEVIERSARTQLHIIEDLLDTARIITGKLRIDTQPTDLRLVLEEALTVVRPAAEAKEINLVSFSEPQPHIVNGDAARLQQVIWNLLQNAIKFTAKGGWVEAHLERQGEHYLITVRDNGQGIEPAFLASVFDRFSQADGSRTRRYGGLGLGLALAQQLVELHGGSIQVASAGRNRGATFTVQLPVYTPQLATAVTGSTAPAPSENEALRSFSHLPDLANLHFLVVDDDAETRQLLTNSLREFNAQITAFSCGADALDFLATQHATTRFHALILDIAMPDEDGYSVLHRLRRWEEQLQPTATRRLPAVALTAHTRSEDRLQALAAGFQMHVTKPVEIAELVAVLASLCGRLTGRPPNAAAPSTSS